MFPTKTILEVNVVKTEQVPSQTNYNTPKMFAVGSAAELIQGERAYSTVADGFNRWYAWVS